MSITVSSHDYSVFGNKAAVVADLAFSGAYAHGGISLDHDQQFGMHTVNLALLETKAGFSFVHDAANKKLKVYSKAPPIIYDEKCTPSSDVITLKYPAAFIMGVSRSGTNKKLRSTGIALADLSDEECSLVAAMAAGEQTQLTVKDYDRLSGQGAFTTASTGWTADTNDWTDGSDAIAKDADGVTTLSHDAFVPVVGRTYRLEYTISSWTVGTVTPSMGGVTGTAVGEDGTFTEEFTAVGVAGLVFTPSNTSRFTIDSVTVYDISEPVYVTYVTQAWKDVWDNLVQDEAITLATGANTLGELIAAAADRAFSGASNWTNVDIASYDETTSGILTLAPDAAAQYCYLPISAAPTVPGTAYKLTLDVTSLTDTWGVYDFTGTQLLGTISATGSPIVIEFTAETYGGLRLVAVAATSALVIDNVSLSVGNKILACMYVDQTEATAVGLTMIDEDDTAATGEVAIKFNSTRNQLTVAAAQNGKDAKITYVKMPASGFLYERAFNDETATKAGIDPYVNVLDHPLLLWGYAGYLPVNGGTTQVMIDSMSTPAAGEFSIDWSQKPRIFDNPPALIVEEVVTCASNVGTLAHLPLYIIAVQVTATTTTGSYSVIPTGETPLTKQVAVNFTTGGLTFLDTDAVTSVKITYIPKRASGYLSSVTVDESKTASASKVNLAARAGLIQYVWDDTDGVLVDLEQPGTAPSATHLCTVDINDSGNSSIDSHADDAGNTYKVTYVPYTQIPPGCFIDDTDITLSSEVWNFTGDPGVLGYNNLVVPGFGVNVIGETGGADRAAAVWIGPTGVDGAGVSLWDPAKNSLTTDNTTAITILSMPWMILDPTQLSPYSILSGQAIDVKSSVTGTGAGVWGRIEEIVTVPLELAEGEDVSDLTSVKGLFIGL